MIKANIPRPIKTAPRNKKIMVFNPVTGWYFSIFKKGQWPLHGWNGMRGIWYPCPTHWMPEPKQRPYFKLFHMEH